MKVAGLFAGVGGFELPFRRRGHSTELLCDNWEPAQQVLARRFPGVPLVGDIRTVRQLPDVDVVTAGFPCTDLSQAGRTAGIAGAQSSLVGEVFRLIRRHRLRWLVLENVRNMLVLDGGHAMRFLTRELDDLGFRWAYRLVDSRFCGVPQRRHRVFLVASREDDPREVLFADNADEPGDGDGWYRRDAFGFYWTEGLRGLGWAPDATPPLKGGSTVGIPSPPGVWVPGAPPGGKLIQPGIADAEGLQGFPRGWTSPARRQGRNGPRWKLVGNAVTVGVASWLVERLARPGRYDVHRQRPLSPGSRWPAAAWGEQGQVWRVDAGLWPRRQRYRHLTDVLDLDAAEALSHRAAAGFLERAQRSRLRFVEEFLLDVKEHVEVTAARGSTAG